MSVTSSSKYDNLELKKSVDLHFFEDSGSNESIDKALDATFTKGTNLDLRDYTSHEGVYEEDFESDGAESDVSDLSESSHSSSSGAETLDINIRGIQIPSMKPDFDDGQLTDVSPLSSSCESPTVESYIPKKQTNIPMSNVDHTGPKGRPYSAQPKISTRSEATSSVLDPTSDASDISKILEHVLDLDSYRDQYSSGVRRKTKPKFKKNLSVNSFSAREIDRENKRLLQKLHRPHRKPLYPGDQKHPPQKRCASASINRCKQFEQIDQENGRILRRLEGVKSSKFLAKNTLDSEHKDFVKYALNCSKSKQIAGVTDYPKSKRYRPGDANSVLMNAWS